MKAKTVSRWSGGLEARLKQSDMTQVFYSETHLLETSNVAMVERERKASQAKRQFGPEERQ